MYSIGVDIGGSHIVACMYGHTYKRILKETLVYEKIDTKASKNAIIQQWVSAISKSIERSGRAVEGIGIAMPGPFNYVEGISLISGVDKLQALYQVNIKKELAEKLGIPLSKIRFINDASAFSVAEALIGQASSYTRVVAITLGTGFGSSFLLEGQPIINAYNVPQRGFLYDKLHKGEPADDIFSTRGIIREYEKISGRTVKNVRELCQSVHMDDKAKEVFRWFGTELGVFLKPYLTDFNAEVLVIGGNISKAHLYFIENLSQQLDGINICISELGEEASIMGGALLLEEDFYRKLMPTLKLM